MTGWGWLRAGAAVAGAVIAAAAAIALSARLSLPVPGSDVPQTLQTLAVLLAGVVLGPRLGALAVAVYLAAGALGLPVFADGASGAGRLIGPTGGFLIAFLPAAALAGWWVESGRAARPLAAFLGMAFAHALVLALGGAWLAGSLGGAQAWRLGVAPFLVGGLLKSLLAAAAAVAVWRLRDR